jgi:hypothetical protein
MINGTVCDNFLSTERLLDAIKKFEDAIKENVEDPAIAQLALSDTIPSWLQAVRFCVKEDIESLGLSEKDAMEFFQPVIHMMVLMIQLYTDAETKEEIQEYLK